jgi:membrane-bound lytic murein transglycosylase D
MHVKTIASLFLLASAAACGGGRQPVATAPAPMPDAPPPPPLETVTPIDAAAASSTSAVIGADLLGSAQYDLPVEANLAVRNELEFLVHQRHAVVGGWMRTAERYHEWVRDVFASHGVPRDLSYLGMIESGYRPTVRSHAGAVGMWQFMPSTGRGMGLRIDDTVDERMDPVRATHAAARHLRYLHRRFNGDWSLAAAAYNAGEGRISRGMGRFGARDFWDLANRGDLAQETRRYVPRLYATTIIAKDPARFGYPAPGPVRRFAFDSVRVDLATPLSVLAQVGNISVNELTELNPHLFRQIAPRDYWVWVPVGQGRALQQAYAASDFRQRGGFGTYRVREGETLSGLAQLAGLTPEQIRSLNLSANTDELRAGTSLRLYADAARVLNARPEPRMARSEPSRGSRPRVLGDPAPAGESESSSSTSGRRAESSASAERASTASAERRSGSSASEGSASTERRTGLVTPAERRAASPESGSSRTRERASSSSSASASTGAAERRAGAGTSERAATTERRSASAEGAAARRASAAEGGSSRASSERAAAPSSSTASSSTASSERRSGGSASSSSARTHTVADGETLWSIARRYDVTVDAVREANEMETETVRLGQTLRIPRAASGSSTASAARADSSRRSASTTTRTDSTSRRSSTSASTARADSSRRSGTTASGTRTESGSSRTSASTGRTPSSPASATRPSSSASGSRPARAREHTVGEGETLWGIARRYETSVDSLRRANDLDADAQIQPGQKLSIPEN